MKHLDCTLPTPAQNVAADEALLDWCEARPDAEVLRCWEAALPFVVVGYANDAAREVNMAACEARGVPILRRCSGGGTVLQGPGCLNYTLVLRITGHGPTRNVAAANRFIMERNCAALQSVLRNPKSAMRVQGFTDLALDGVKFSGNAQRRKRRCLLFHGTILLGLDLALVDELLQMPSRQPDYRQNRSHREFIRNLSVDRESVKHALRGAWQAGEDFGPLPLEAIATLVREKYGRREWNLRRDLPHAADGPGGEFQGFDNRAS
jgi:lipoate-protein ligase A